jgi:ribonuclease BN (tRNA processing enzyme)
MKSDIILDVIGNTTAFSLVGESSGYLITVNGQRYLLECGAQVFPTLGYRGLDQIRGIFASHSHEDHRRWFTDIVLYNRYDSKSTRRVRLISVEAVLEEYHKNSKGALERSLSQDSKQVIDVPYEHLVEAVVLGPRSRYFIALETVGPGSYSYRVRDREGNAIGPDKAKIVINPVANRPRLLFKDDETAEWVEPQSYYPFSSTQFYEKEQNPFVDEAAGLTVEAVNAPVWHGVPTIGFRFKTVRNTLFYSADTVYKPSLWKELYQTYRPQRFETIRRQKFEEQSIIIGDINDFTERTWSRQRYEDAMKAYQGAVVIHDVARKNSVVHTNYQDICDAHVDQLLFTHTPDNLTARRPILKSGKRIVLRSGRVYEWVDGRLFAFEADVYVKHLAQCYAGYRSRKGAYKLISKNGLLGLVEATGPEKGLMRLDLYEDVNGRYFPILIEPNKFYRTRTDGQVEEVTVDETTTIGRLVRNARDRLRRPSPAETVGRTKGSAKPVAGHLLPSFSRHGLI